MSTHFTASYFQVNYGWCERGLSQLWPKIGKIELVWWINGNFVDNLRMVNSITVQNYELKGSSQLENSLDLGLHLSQTRRATAIARKDDWWCCCRRELGSAYLLDRSMIARLEGLFIRDLLANDISAWTRVIIILRVGMALVGGPAAIAIPRLTLTQNGVWENQIKLFASYQWPRSPWDSAPPARPAASMERRRREMRFLAFWKTVSVSPWLVASPAVFSHDAMHPSNRFRLRAWAGCCPAMVRHRRRQPCPDSRSTKLWMHRVLTSERPRLEFECVPTSRDSEWIQPRSLLSPDGRSTNYCHIFP